MDQPYQSSRNQSTGAGARRQVNVGDVVGFDDAVNALISASGGGAAVAWNAATVQVGAVGVYECQATIAAPAVAGGDVLEVCLADTAITDENEPEDLDLKFIRAKAGSGSVEFTLRFHEKTSGPINLLWRKTT